jgi:ketosteroid isomerase-like protein
VTARRRTEYRRTEQGGTAVRDEAIRQELEDLYREWFASYANPDPDYFARYLADEWVYTDYTGNVYTTKDWLELISPHLSSLEVELLSLDADVYGDVVVATGEYHAKGELNGTPVDQKNRYTSAWINQDGGWRLVAHQATKVTHSLYR